VMMKHLAKHSIQVHAEFLQEWEFRISGPYQHPVAQQLEGNILRKCFKKAKYYDDDLCDSWREDLQSSNTIINNYK